MDRASMLFRRARSGGCSSPVNAHSAELLLAISQFKEMEKSIRKFSEAQSVAFQALQTWGESEESRAIQDVCYQFQELNLLWSEVQRRFGDNVRFFWQTLESISEGEKRVDQARQQLQVKQQQEARIKRDFKKSYKRLSVDERKSMEAKLAQAEASSSLAGHNLFEINNYHSYRKYSLVKHALFCLPEAYCELGDKCSIVHNSMYHIVHKMPARQFNLNYNQPDDVVEADSRYTASGAQLTRQIVMQTRHKVQRYRSRVRPEQMPNVELPVDYPFELDWLAFDDDDQLRVHLAGQSSPMASAASATACTSPPSLASWLSMPATMSLVPPGSPYEAPPPYTERAATSLGGDQLISSSSSPPKSSQISSSVLAGDRSLTGLLDAGQKDRPTTDPSPQESSEVDGVDSHVAVEAVYACRSVVDGSSKSASNSSLEEHGTGPATATAATATATATAATSKRNRLRNRLAGLSRRKPNDNTSETTTTSTTTTTTTTSSSTATSSTTDDAVSATVAAATTTTTPSSVSSTSSS